MQDLILHLLKSAGLISLFYLGYFFLLKNDTSFKANRFFLLAGIFTSLLLPFLEITRTVEVEATAVPLFLENFSTKINPTPTMQPQLTIDWWLIAGAIYLSGLGFFLLKFFMELFSLLRLIFTHKTSRNENFLIINKPGITQPFSFFNYIVLDPNQHSALEKELIIKHEMSHARQWHSIDQIISSLSIYLLWFNPLSWLYRKSLVQNLEFLADKEVVAEKVSKKEYQKTLLKISVSSFEPALSNQFYQSLIKKRIMMINKNTPQKSHFWKVSFLLPFLFLFVLFFNVETVAQVNHGTDPNNQVTSNVEIAVTITKNTAQESLSRFEKLFKKRDVLLKFAEPVFSNEGLLTAVNITYLNNTTGKSGNLNLNNSNGIESTVIFSNSEETGFRQPKKAPELMTESGFFELGKKPLFLIGNIEYSTEKLYGKTIELDGNAEIIKPNEARQNYGDKAADGAIIIPKGTIISDFNLALKNIDADPKAQRRHYIQIEKDKTPFFISLASNIENENEEKAASKKYEEVEIQAPKDDINASQWDNSNKQIYSVQETKPLVFINGVEQDVLDASDLDPSKIKEVTILKGKDAVKKYGDGAENGAIEIELKTNEEHRVNISSETNSEPVTIVLNKIDFKERKSLSVRDVGSADPDASKSLYVVDGKEMPGDFDPDSISAEKIESVTVLKGEKAIAQYGQKASKGVIVIITKK